VFLWIENDFAQSAEAEKKAAVIELGDAFGRGLRGAESSFGGDVAVEVTPIENWLELEAGVTPLFGRHFNERPALI